MGRKRRNKEHSWNLRLLTARGIEPHKPSEPRTEYLSTMDDGTVVVFPAQSTPPQGNMKTPNPVNPDLAWLRTKTGGCLVPRAIANQSTPPPTR